MPDTPTLSRRRLCWILCVLLLLGCGGVQGEADGAQVLTIAGRDHGYAAYQDGAGTWRPLATPSAEGTLRLTLKDPQGRYGVMNLCLDEATGNLNVTVRHALLREAAVVTLGCAARGAEARVVVSGRMTGLGDGDYGNVYLGDAAALVDPSAPEHRLELPASRYDLIATRYRQGQRVPDRIVYRQGVEADGAEVGGNPQAASRLDVDFFGPDALEPRTAVLPLLGVRPDELLSGSVEIVTETGTVALLGEHLGGGTLLYARIPEGELRGASLRAAAQSFSYDDRTKAGSSRSVSRTFAADEAPLLALPQPLAEPLLGVSGDAALFRARWRAHPAGPGSYTQFYSQLQVGGRQNKDRHSVSYRVSQSPGWLAGRPYSYALPDFGTLPGWRKTWELRRGEPVFWEVSYTRATETATHHASRSGVLTP